MRVPSLHQVVNRVARVVITFCLPVSMATAFFVLAIQCSMAGTVVGWGDNRFGQNDVPSDLLDVVAISANALHTLALKRDGTVMSWGFNGSGQTSVPPGLSNATAVAAGYTFSVAVKSDGTMIGWGMLGGSSFYAPANLMNVVQVSGGLEHCVVLRADGTVVAWGDTNYQQVREASAVPAD